MPERTEIIAAFLDRHGWDPALRKPLAGDASFRHYDRLIDGDRRAVLMDAPPLQENIRPFVAIAELLSGLGYSAPTIQATDTENGLLLIEDLGDDTYTRVLAGRGDAVNEYNLYALAVDLLADLHGRPASETIPADLPPYDEDKLLTEALLLTDWYMPAVLGQKTDAICRDAYIAAWREALSPVLEAEPTLVLRDYHVDNLMWLPQRSGVAACGVLDFQDAVAGHPAYDLMSLLEDARRDIADDLRESMMARYFGGIRGFAKKTEEAFRRDFSILAAQRHAKVIGIFTRLSRRDAKDDYLVHIPRVWALLERALDHPALAPVAAWMAECLAPGLRSVPAAKLNKEV